MLILYTLKKPLKPGQGNAMEAPRSLWPTLYTHTFNVMSSAGGSCQTYLTLKQKRSMARLPPLSFDFPGCH